MADTKKIVHINYKASFEDTGKMFDTNIEACAKQNDIYDEKAHYAPAPYIIGSKSLYCEVDEAIAAAEIGKEVEVVVPCEKAAGARNPKLIELHAIKDFYKQEINPYPGMVVTLGNRTGIVLSVGAGRVKIDFNSFLAGHDLCYKVTVVDEITDPIEKVKAIIGSNYNSADEFGVEVSEDKIALVVPDICKYHDGWLAAKFRIVSDLRTVFGIDRIEFTEVWESVKTE